MASAGTESPAPRISAALAVPGHSGKRAVVFCKASYVGPVPARAAKRDAVLRQSLPDSRSCVAQIAPPILPDFRSRAPRPNDRLTKARKRRFPGALPAAAPRLGIRLLTYTQESAESCESCNNFCCDSRSVNHDRAEIHEWNYSRLLTKHKYYLNSPLNPLISG